MPMYDYFCFDCELGKERLSTIARRNASLHCDECDGSMELIISAPAVQVWNTDRSFPNLSNAGDGSRSFESKRAYQDFLVDSGVDELSTSAPNYRPHGNRLVGSWK